ncbi:hypothetical protein A6M27_16605 [Acidithiobacillus thiooxidans]|uniref:Outer membrane protein beta-barrel domain-containing protein n=1 Tax=Acidithiobacillus thiooxidans TaxID=930 RepID=A0A1C2JC31_ACITH|nr:hypothetical protein [Acidithiobacillus thiooxidans]OCX67807.1 hypothetical protein A6P07_19295 [Acidithiobacillus thiooxidans]OCX77879.1 hypothetical protein A6O24_06000 [Acidithiobacillus thiooxidans]OCX84146.1 hypothetical protein A6M27_16605 [Acidithiobacillus thiooxidans]OCX85793.1 hypothetical protein A6O26_00170 [Acidithiobacillus thiooxidans]OFC48526.1 hypothetical protein BAE47_07480 [Acidithiobacillus thiooxidans]
MRPISLRKSRIIALSLMALMPGTALATTLSLEATYLNLQLNTPVGTASGNMLGAQVRLRQDLGNNWSDALTLSGNSGQGASLVGAGFSVGKAFSLGPVWLRPAFKLQSDWLSAPGLNLRTAQAGISLHAYYPLSSALTAYASINAGETFANHVSLELDGPLHLSGTTTGGLAYGGSAGLDYAVGPGVVNLGYHYQRTPISSGLKLTTGQAEIGYRISF